MATKKTVSKPAPRQYESIAGKEGRIKTDILITNPKTVITIVGELKDELNLELRFLVDSFLKEKGL
ncbi:hypothetical protein [Sphingobacterium yanglingense]|uniref:Uncharacterized protein n=1 Tax=Sphingobacterium yanglingense TaxID=1437280 RepID=A0A4R6WH89_9SPHI|nr:hypothetical protein [Sphingobacterium yanglingense]TDQ79560.1 hypothetical protein CLV99_1003 [Sphingobacterium yanglingense]